jgi:hypothetical protein
MRGRETIACTLITPFSHFYSPFSPSPRYSSPFFL